MALTDNPGSPAQDQGTENTTLNYIYAAGAVVSLLLGVIALWQYVKGKGGN